MLRRVPRTVTGCWVFLLAAPLLWTVLDVWVQPAIAQVPEPVPEPPPTFELPEIVVPGKRPQPAPSTPASVSVVTREEIERSGARTVADALRMVVELSVRAYGGLGGLAQPSIRGSTPAQVLVLLDGIPLNSVALGQTDLSTISVDAVERIEILRGPFSALYGSGALGGVINIITTKVGHRQLVGRTGGFGQRSASLAVTDSRSVPWSLTISSDATAGHRTNSDYAGTTLVTQVGLSPDTGLLVHYYAADLGTPGDVASPTPNDRQAERRTLVQVESGSADRSGPWGRIYYVADSLAAVSVSSFGTSYSSYYSTLLGGEWQRVWPLGSQRVFTGGIEAQRQALDAVVFGSPIVQAAVIGAGYLQYDAAISDRALASLGLRLDSHSVYGATLNPRAGVVYQLNEATRLRAAVGRTFRGPTFLELFYPGCSNPSLQPETAWAGEVAVERQAGPILWTTTVFGTAATNLIVGGCSPQNIGIASILGVSVEARGMVGSMRVAANITATRAVDAASGNPLLRVPGVTANLAVHHQVAPSALLSVLAAYVGPRPDVQFDPVTFTSTTVQLPGYVDLRIRYQVTTPTEWAITLGVDNALDWRYEAVKGYPAPSRSVFLTATKKI